MLPYHAQAAASFVAMPPRQRPCCSFTSTLSWCWRAGVIRCSTRNPLACEGLIFGPSSLKWSQCVTVWLFNMCKAWSMWPCVVLLVCFSVLPRVQSCVKLSVKGLLLIFVWQSCVCTTCELGCEPNSTKPVLCKYPVLFHNVQVIPFVWHHLVKMPTDTASMFGPHHVKFGWISWMTGHMVMLWPLMLAINSVSLIHHAPIVLSLWSCSCTQAAHTSNTVTARRAVLSGALYDGMHVCCVAYGSICIYFSAKTHRLVHTWFDRPLRFHCPVGIEYMSSQIQPSYLQADNDNRDWMYTCHL